jgi:adenylylsulfate kinase-like enzyme
MPYRISAVPVPVARTALALGPVIVWLNGTHGAGKTTTSALVQQLIPDSRVFDAC